MVPVEMHVRKRSLTSCMWFELTLASRFTLAFVDACAGPAVCLNTLSFIHTRKKEQVRKDEHTTNLSEHKYQRGTSFWLDFPLAKRFSAFPARALFKKPLHTCRRHWSTFEGVSSHCLIHVTIVWRHDQTVRYPWTWQSWEKQSQGCGSIRQESFPCAKVYSDVLPIRLSSTDQRVLFSERF